MATEIKEYKGYIFKRMYRQWVNQVLGGFATFKEAVTYIDNILTKKKRGLVNS